MAFNDTPHRGVINGVVAMDDAITKADDSRQFVDAPGGSRIGSRQTVEGLADDLKFTLDRPAKLTIGFVIFEGTTSTLTSDAARRFSHIKQ